MVRSTSENLFIPVMDSSGSDLPQQGLWLLLLHAEKIPPHLAMIHNGRYFSLEVSGCSIGADVQEVSRLIGLKKIPAVLLPVDPKWKAGELEEHLWAAYGNYDRIEGAKVTCLSPILDFFQALGLDMGEVSLVHELIPLLDRQGWMEQGRIHFPGTSFQSGDFSMKRYTKKEVIERIGQVSAQLN